MKSWLREIARALDFVAEQGLVHRDVKPSNILFDSHGNAFLSDFGLAKITYGEHVDGDSEMTGAGFVVGTPNYLAPELVLGQKFDGRVDQYALGILVYHLLTGAPPMQGASSAATMVNQTTKVLPLLNRVRKDVPESLAMAVQKAIHKKPSRRFASSTDFADAVLASLSAGSGSRLRQVPQARNATESLSSMGEAIEEPPRVSTGQKGLVPCPKCRIPLPLQPVQAGRRGRCVHCNVRLKVSKSLNKLIQLPNDDGRSKKSDGSNELVLGEKVFGWQMSKQTAAVLAGVLLTITLAITVYLTIFVTGKTAEEELNDKVNSMRATESR